MRSSRLGLCIPSAAFVVAALSLAAPPALPCSPPLPSLDGRAIPDGGDLLPVNGVLHARLSAFGAVGASVRADSQVVGRALDVDDIAGVSRINLEGLAPSTSYTLTLSMPASFVAQDGEGRTRDIHFTTARTADTAPPAFVGAARVVVTHIPASEFVDSCGGGGVDENAIDIFLPRVVDDSGLAGIKLLRVNADGARELRQFALTQLGDDEDERVLADSQRVPGDYVYELVAVDQAGNESPPLAVDVNVPGAGAVGCSGASGSASAVPMAFALVLLGRARRARMQS